MTEFEQALIEQLKLIRDELSNLREELIKIGEYI